jgi:hypothetical protein
MYIFLVTAISIPLWAPAHILSPATCSPFIMVFSPKSNSSLGIMGTIILSVFLVIICLSLITVTWDTCRPSPQRRSSYLEFDPAGLEGYVPDTSHSELLAAKKTLISYGLAIFCLYVIAPIFLSDFRLAYSQILRCSLPRDSRKHQYTLPQLRYTRLE